VELPVTTLLRVTPRSLEGVDMEDFVRVTEPGSSTEDQERAEETQGDAHESPDEKTPDGDQDGADRPAKDSVDAA
jgi:hypothetical protein